MAYPDDLLADNEHVVVHKHPHWKTLILPVLVLLVTIGLGVYLAALIQDESWANIGWIVLAGLAGLVLLVFVLAPLVRWRSTHFVLTTQRIMYREGVLKREGIDIPLSHINSVRFSHGLVDRVLGCGTLVVESASDEPLEFDDIPGVERVHTLLYREVNDDPNDDFIRIRKPEEG
ncbi:membrane protein YdbS with pleckstrin-like domain [Crossiella equi]|uniref:Membrane protein YdbS with pleckstrin-like domain n=1 Tax=Crossiella equi TaxID=130796 RepID=A0ABS5ADJ8_9PSEU|nr:PH domain-containing protein [Crossiella equi]MBP2474644.1 membrane protein YdbS with pleckstrin-like domain [Crossiella equi]